MFEYDWQNKSHYNRFREACKHVDNDRTIYTWRINSADSGNRSFPVKEGLSIFHENGPTSKILEPIYFKPGDQIECSTTAVGTNGQQGELKKMIYNLMLLHEDEFPLVKL